jgi:phage replication O-like protein O
MASPQLENGHLRIAHEVWEHLMRGGFTGTELSLVMAVIRQTWGWKKKEAEISLGEFRELTDQSESTAARVLNALLAKRVLVYSKGGGRGIKSKWSFNKDWETWQTLSSVRENRKPDTLPSVREFTLTNERVSDCNLLPGLEQQPPREIFKERKEKGTSSPGGKRDPAYDYFTELFEGKNHIPYQKSKGDFVQLAALRKSLKIDPHDTPPDWEIACRNYLDSPMGSCSLAHMVTGNRYAFLRKSKLDRYGKPDIGDSGIGSKPKGSLEDRNREVIRQVQRESVDERNQKLSEQVDESSQEASKRLQERSHELDVKIDEIRRRLKL